MKFTSSVMSLALALASGVAAYTPPPSATGVIKLNTAIGGNIACHYEEANPTVASAQRVLHRLRVVAHSKEGAQYGCKGVSPDFPGINFSCNPMRTVDNVNIKFNGTGINICGPPGYGPVGCLQAIEGLQSVINLCAWEGHVAGSWRVPDDRYKYAFNQDGTFIGLF